VLRNSADGCVVRTQLRTSRIAADMAFATAIQRRQSAAMQFRRGLRHFRWVSTRSRQAVELLLNSRSSRYPRMRRMPRSRISKPLIRGQAITFQNHCSGHLREITAYRQLWPVWDLRMIEEFTDGASVRPCVTSISVSSYPLPPRASLISKSLVGFRCPRR